MIEFFHAVLRLKIDNKLINTEPTPAFCKIPYLAPDDKDFILEFGNKNYVVLAWRLGQSILGYLGYRQGEVEVII